MKGVVHRRSVVSRALALSRLGHSDYEVARELGIPRSTIQNWRCNGAPSGRRRREQVRHQRPIDERAYSYLLGMYLGDGCLVRYERTYALLITLDKRYPGIVRECVGAMGRSLPRPVRSQPPRGGAIRLYSYSPSWVNLFPQHGAGRKHRRRIWLADWQSEITERYTREFIRGLIHSDGSRCINRFSVKLPSGRVGNYAYPRYFFTNYSIDIQRIFCDHCDMLGIRWSQSNRGAGRGRPRSGSSRPRSRRRTPTAISEPNL